jgi:hypothetical protein
MEGKISRRNFLIAIGAGLLLPTACRPNSVSTAENKLQESTPFVDLGKQNLTEELDKLPDTPIKRLLQSRIRPLFGSNPPTKINYDGLQINLANPTVVLKTENINQVSGLYTLRANFKESFEAVYPTVETTLRLPYMGLLFNSEVSLFSKSDFGTDGTPLIDITFPVDKPLYSGLAPAITITTPDLLSVEPKYRQFYINMRRFSFVKEACSALLVDIYFETVIRKMHELGLSTTVSGRSVGEPVKQTEAITQSIAVINNHGGRMRAAIDMAGYLLAFKATKGTEIDDPNNTDENFAKLRPEMESAQLGITAQETLYKSFIWTLTTPKANELLAHAGNIAIIP